MTAINATFANMFFQSYNLIFDMYNMTTYSEFSHLPIKNKIDLSKSGSTEANKNEFDVIGS